MAPSIIYNNAAVKEIFLPGQIFVFGGFALRANSLGHLDQIDSYAPGHQISFGNLNYVADIRGDLIFQGFEAPTTAPALDPERVTRSEDGSLEPAGIPAALRLHTERIASPAIIARPDSSPDTGSEPLKSTSCELGPETSIPVQTTLLNEALDLM